MRPALLALAALLAFLAGPAAADGDPPAPPLAASPDPATTATTAAAPGRFGGELFVGGFLADFHDVGIRALDLRLGIGQRLPAQRVLGIEGVEGWALFTVGGQLGSTKHELDVRMGRLGLGVRGRAGRVTVGLDAEALVLVIVRRSTSGELRGTGLGARALLAVDVVRLGDTAIYAGLEGTFAKIGASDDPYLLGAAAGAGFRW